MEQSCFLKENAKFLQEEEIVLSKRLEEQMEISKWVIKPITQKQCEELLKKSNYDSKKFETAVIVKSVVQPDLEAVSLQTKFQAIGAEQLLLKMLLAGEYDQLREEVERMNGKIK